MFKGFSMRRLVTTSLLLLSFSWRPAALRGEEPAAVVDPGPFNLVAPTLGGLQLWSDELFFHDWHIQRNVLTGHCRLLDGSHCRRAWGTFEQCQARLEQLKEELQLPPMRGKAVIVLHGLIRSRYSMHRLSNYLREQGGYTVFNVNYPSTRGSVGEHAAALARIVERLDGIEEINFVSHSLGSLVIRHYLADQSDPAAGRCPDPRIHRIVMIGPPNNGAELAEKVGDNQVFKTLFGPAGQQLAHDWPQLQGRLATPACEFGIVAGGRGDGRGFNPLLAGDDDCVVTVASTRLKGARDFALLPLNHSLMTQNATVLEQTLRFLEQGHFVSEAQRQPILE